MSTTLDKVCQSCGHTFEADNPRRLLCPECRRKNRREAWLHKNRRVCREPLVGLLGQREVARILGCSHQNVRAIERRAFVKLQRLRQDPAMRAAWEQVRGALPELEMCLAGQLQEMVTMRDRLLGKLSSGELADVNRELELCQMGIDRIRAIKL